jgi:hypothetical protein
MIAEAELQRAFDGHDRTTRAQVVHGHLSGGNTESDRAARVGNRLTHRHDRSFESFSCCTAY